jgi:hypothetical protein
MMNRQAGWHARSSLRRAWRVPCMAARRELQGGGGTLWLAPAPSDTNAGGEPSAADLHPSATKADADPQGKI